MAICITCGQKFNVKKGGQKFCSPKCYHVSRLGYISTLRKRVNRICPVCGTEFETGGRAGDVDKLFCSWECRYKARYRKGKQSRELALTDAAYLAGFLDGEGSIILHMDFEVVRVRIQITNTNLEVIEWLRETTGVGNIVEQKRRSSQHKNAYHWMCNSESAESILKQIQPYLKIKRKQAALALDVQNRLRDPAQKPHKDWQLEAREQMKILNKRGPQ